MARIVVSGYMVRHPLAGNLLAFFQYVLGFHRLGHDVFYLEESGWPFSSYDPETRHWTDHPAAGLRVVRELVASQRAKIPVIYVNRETGHVDGASWDEVADRLRAADVLVNVGGVCELPEFENCRRRAIVDMDPLFTQVERFGAERWISTTSISAMARISAASAAPFPPAESNGCRLSRRSSSTSGNGPRRLRMPRSRPLRTGVRMAAVNHEGEHYGQKDEEFLRFIELPRHSARRLELSLSGGQESRQRLRDAGWSIRDAGEELGCDVLEYARYIRASFGEFSVAKNAYVKSRSGWFSDRSACYLAAGLPVVLEETGFSDWLPVGKGVLAFRTLLEAASCLEQVALDHEAHRRAARAVAETVFSHDRVLPRLLDRTLA